MRTQKAKNNIWDPLIGDDSPICQKEKENGNVQNTLAVTIIRGNNVVGMPHKISAVSPGFLSLAQTSIRAEVLDPRVNRGAGHGLEISVRFIFQGHAKVIGWARQKIKDAEEKLEKHFRKFMKSAV